ncbi:Hydroxymethylglutaryl-CoA synthase [Phytophthora nicotianae]|uniref:Hydroxymethylglutaryl-CoA synthase n=1 Tax=Phytophthora nicotianae TaxID=4792 RepID=A0A0W8AY62_PHYNI|nr:Hydroxymethylglutaryl-CoA synthase [Phytophthora nicotianae]
MVSSARPSDVGILAMEVHFPSDFVDQREMETFDGVGSGKYTLGLGQLGMAVPGDREDVNALALTAVSRLMSKFQKSEGTANGKAPGVASVDYAVFHSPYNKLVQKSFARLLFLDSRRSLKTGDEAAKEKFAQLAKWVDTPLEETLNDRELDLAVRGVAKEDFNTKVSPSCTTSQQLGNCYTAAVYMNLATLVHARAKDLALGSRVLMFSYGSGSLATMFVLRTREPAERKFSLENIAKSLDLTARLERRNKKTPEEYTARMKLREKTYGAKNGVKLTQSIASIPEGEFYLDRIDEMGRRFYARSKPQVTSEGDNQEQQRLVKSTQELAGAVYVAGTSVGLPGQAKVFEGEKSIEKLLQGENCICELSDKDKDRMVAQNITQVHKDKATGEVTRSPVSTHDKCIQVSAVVNDVDLEKDYGIAATIANSMDKPTQLAVAAGLEAVRNAGLVDGVNGNWRLPESMRDSTGVIYATSFPTMNAAVSETSRYYEEKEGDDTASSETMMPLIGGGFRALGAACIAPTAETAARPFDVKRSGMIVGSGAIGVVLESPLAFAERQVAEPATGKTVRLLATQFSNSAYHGAALEPNHVGQELVRFLQRVESDFGITREEIARNGVYYSHETGTNASPKSSCAYTEVTALRTAFGSELLSKLTIANTKGFTGHPMAVSFEDVAAIEGLRSGRVPPVVHFETHDSNLGETPLRLATGEAYAHKYALHFAAGFGSQLAFTLYTLEN